MGVRPSRVISARTVSDSHRSGLSASYIGSVCSTLYSQPVATAPAKKQSPTFACRSASDHDSVARIVYCISVRLGDDIGDLAALGDNAVHLLPGCQLLTQQPDGDLGHRGRIGGVDTQKRCGRGMGFAPVVVDPDRGQRQRAGGRDIHRPGMHHHGHRQVVEDSGVEHQDFSAAELLGRCAQQRNRQVELFGDIGQCQRGAHCRRGDDVVTAGMTDPGQRVVLSAHADGQRTAAEVGPKSGVQSTGRRGDVETSLSQQRLGLGATAVLGERQLRFGVDRVRKLDQVRATAPYRVLDAIQHRD